MITVALIESVNFYLALGTIIALLALVVLVYDLRHKQILASHISRWGMIFAFFITLGASIMTLIYSDIFGLIPCGLCWLERIALYPQVLLIGAALFLKDTLMPRYGIVLSVFGLIISLYHHYIQMGGSEFIKCPASGAGADCAKRFLFEFGFITFPLMAAVLFAFLIILYLYILKASSSTANSSRVEG